MRQDLQKGVVREHVNESVMVAFGLAGTCVRARLGVDHGDSLGRRRGRGRGVGLMAVTGEGRRGERGGLGWQDKARAGGT